MKSFVSALPVSVIVGLLAFQSPDNALLEGAIRNLLGWPLGLLEWGVTAAGFGVQAKLASDFAFGPAMPATGAALSLFWAFALCMLSRDGRPIVDRWWPAAPDCLDPRIEHPDRDALDPRARKSAFHGRDDELAHLKRFVGPGSGEAPAWMLLTGGEGMGKSRLAVELMAYLAARGWDVGFLEEDATPGSVMRCHFRRETLVVIDNAARLPGGPWPVLDALLQKEHKLRVLLVEQYAPARDDRLADAARKRIDDRARPELRLAPLGDAALAAIAPRLSPQLRMQAAGRPLSLLLGPDPAHEIARRADQRERQFDADEPRNAASLLALSALAGPVERRRLAGLLREASEIPVLTRVFEGASPALLRRTLPALEPDWLANAALLRAVDTLADETAEELFTAAARANPEALGRRMVQLWSSPWTLSPAHGEARDRLTAWYRAKCPEAIEAALRQAEALVDEIAALVLANRGHPDMPRVLAARAMLLDLCRLHGFDRRFALCEARSDVNTALLSGYANQLDRVESLSQKLVTLVENERFAKDRDFRLQEAICACNAMLFHGKAGRVDDVERWGGRLVALAEDEILGKVEEIRGWEAMGAVNGIHAYGMSGRFGDMERWGARLIALTEDARFAASSPIRLGEAKGATNAVAHYAEANRFDGVERWGARLIALAKDARFAGVLEIRSQEATASYNAMLHYGRTGQFDDLERWGSRLIALCENPDFAGHLPIRRDEAMAAVNAIGHYGQAGLFEHVERWGRRLVELADDPRFAGDPTIRRRESMGAFNAMLLHGERGRMKDMERWSQRMTALVDDRRFADDPAIRLNEAKGANSAIIAYGAASDSGRWRERLAQVSLAFPYHAEIQQLANQNNLSVLQQKAAGWRHGKPKVPGPDW